MSTYLVTRRFMLSHTLEEQEQLEISVKESSDHNIFRIGRQHKRDGLFDFLVHIIKHIVLGSINPVAVGRT